MSSSYLATALQVLREFQVGFIISVLECRQVFGILRQAQAHGLVHQVGTDRSISAAFSRSARCRCGSK